MDYLQKLQHHYATDHGWVNDPNGLVCFKGYYHVFYQHAPHHEVPWQEPMHWGHARTRDFLTWEELPVALCPDAPYDNCGCWSGTAIVKDGVLYLVYASLYVPEGEKDAIQTVSVAYSTDGIHFEKYANNPVIERFPADGCPDFRDPAVCCIDGVYYCVMASGYPPEKKARLLLYRGTDLFTWEYAGVMCEWDNAKFTECPSFVPIDGERCLLTASVCYDDAHRFSVMYGRFRDGKFTVEHTAEVDKGPDQYAGQVFRDPRGRNLLISWMPGWRYKGYAARDVGCMSVPRELTITDGVIRAYPVEEVRHLLTAEDPCLVRTADGFTVAREGRDPLIWRGELRELAVLRDGYIAEIFVNGGEEVYSVLL